MTVCLSIRWLRDVSREVSVTRRLNVALCALVLTAPVGRAQPGPLAEAQYVSAMDQVQRLHLNAPASGGQTILSRQEGAIASVIQRDRSGQAEIHTEWNDHIFVQDGEATITLGGTAQNARQAGDGEIRGDAISGGRTVVLHAGDYVFVPAKLPHLMTLRPGTTIRYGLVKTKQ